MKVYGTHICIDCRNYQAIQASRGFEAEFIDITADTANLKEFLALRDHDPVFAPVREHGGIGIPLFVREDGRKTFDIDEALSWIGQPPVREEEIVEPPLLRQLPVNGKAPRPSGRGAFAVPTTICEQKSSNPNICHYTGRGRRGYDRSRSAPSVGA